MDPNDSAKSALSVPTATPAIRADNVGAEQFPRGSETEERLAADRRGRKIGRDRSAPRVLPPERDDPRLINTALAALCETVRDYAIFVMNHEGIIVYWGMGAHLTKWWNAEEAEGAHLRFLYPEGGSEDGTAEQHLAEAAATGEYVGEGQRVRRGGSTFWGHIVLTGLRDTEGKLLGFIKVTQDLTKRRATEAAVALANEAQSISEAAVTTAQEAHVARERADDARLRAEAARERAEDAAAFAREQARSAHEHIAKLLGSPSTAEHANRSGPDTDLDVYVRTFAQQELEEEDQHPASDTAQPGRSTRS
jgi:PAS domain S-box-containing protein